MMELRGLKFALTLLSWAASLKLVEFLGLEDDEEHDEFSEEESSMLSRSACEILMAASRRDISTHSPSSFLINRPP